MRIAVWSDVVCPFCYIGKRKLEAALAATGLHPQIEWRSFELDPAAPRLIEASPAQLLAAKYGFSQARALDLLDRQRRAADEVDLRFNLADLKRGNTFDAHRLIQAGRAAGLADALNERFMRGYFTEGAPIGDPVALRALAVEAGLAAAEADRVLAGDAFADDVRADEHRAAELGVHAVPHFLIDGRSAIVGARPVAEFVSALTAAAGG